MAGCSRRSCRRSARSGPRRCAQRVADGLTTTFASSYTDEVSLAEALDPAAIAVYGRQATGEKYLVNPAK